MVVISSGLVNTLAETGGSTGTADATGISARFNVQTESPPTAPNFV